MSDWCLSEQVLAWWWHPVTSSEALDLLYQAMCAVLYQRTAAAIKTASFLGVFVDCCLFACCPGGRWGNTDQVVAQRRCPVASGVALDMLHWAMPSVLLRRTAVAIEMAGGWGAFVYHRRLVCINIHSYKTMLWSIKTKDELTICLLLCLELVCILLAATDKDGCRFGHHCCRRTSSNSIKHEVDKNILIYTTNQTKSFDSGLGKNMRKAARPSSGVVSSNPRCWRGKRLHHHGGGVCWLFVLLWIDSWRHETIVCKKWYKNNL